jgi:hypothetical protein
MKTLILGLVVISSFIASESSFAGMETLVRLGKAYYRSKPKPKPIPTLGLDQVLSIFRNSESTQEDVERALNWVDKQRTIAKGSLEITQLGDDFIQQIYANGIIHKALTAQLAKNLQEVSESAQDNSILDLNRNVLKYLIYCGFFDDTVIAELKKLAFVVPQGVSVILGLMPEVSKETDIAEYSTYAGYRWMQSWAASEITSNQQEN